MKLGILTGGGDCPGLNAVVRSVAVTGHKRHGDELLGFLDGWRGVLEGSYMAIDPERARRLLAQGGTILGTSRTNPYATESGPDLVVATLSSLGVDALVAVGGEDTLGVADRLHRDRALRVVGVPKTIDNDLSGTEVTFGFATAVQTATEAIDRLQTTAESHHRVIVCEVMGRHAGWIAASAGIAGGADEILVPERPFDVDEVCDRVRRRFENEQFSSLVVVAEGAVPAEGPDAERAAEALQGEVTDAFGHPRLGGIGAWLAEIIEERTRYEARVTTLGHIQRGGTPIAFDRILATRFGVAAIEAIHDQDFGVMVALQSNMIVRVPLSEAVGRPKTLDASWLEVAAPFLG